MPIFDDILLRLSIMLRLMRFYGAILVTLRAAKPTQKCTHSKILSVFPGAISAILEEHLCHCARNARSNSENPVKQTHETNLC